MVEARLIMYCQETINVFKSNIRKSLHNDKDLFLYPKIPSYRYASLRKDFELNYEEEILLLRDTTFWNVWTQGTVVTDWGITYIEDDSHKDQMIKLSWQELDHVDFKGGDFYFFLVDETNPVCRISAYDIIITSRDVEANSLVRTFNAMANTQISETVLMSKAIDRFYTLYNKNQTEALQVGLDFRERFQNASLTPDIAWLLYKQGQSARAIQILEEDCSNVSGNVGFQCELLWTLYSIYEQIHDLDKARAICACVVNNVPADYMHGSVSILEDAKADLQKYDSAFVDTFLQRTYNQRKLLVPVKEYTDLFQSAISVVNIYHLPAISFPIGHPVANHLYVGHPFVASKYLLYENYELELIEDRVREFCQLVQSLGATEIQIDCINRSSNRTDYHTNQQLSGSVDYKAVAAKGAYETDRINKLMQEISRSVNLHQRFSPTDLPYLPDGLIWYPHEPSWQRLCQQRLQGAINEHEERIETKTSQVVNRSEMQQVMAELKVLLLNANVKWDKSIEEKLEVHENAIISIHVKFAPIEYLNQKNNGWFKSMLKKVGLSK